MVTVTDVVGTPKDFTTELFNLWGVGDAKTDSGLLIVLVMQQRRLEMETGYGLEGTLSDGWLGTMQSSVMVPHFKRGEHGKGLAAGLAAVEAKLSGSGDLGSSSPGIPSIPESSVGPAPIIGGALAFLCTFGAFGAMVLGVVLFIRWRRRKERLCPQCQIETDLLSESDEDAYLDEGQEAEEATGAVQWDVRLCPGCRDVRVIDKTPWYRMTVRCEACGYRTGKVKRQVIRAATYSSTGTGRVTRTCSHCDHRTQRTYVISMKTRSSSSGSFGSGGGGFSSGGCLLYTSPSPRDRTRSRMPSSA